MRVLVTGTDGYIGCMLPRALIDRGHHVLGVDTGFHRAGWLYNGVERTAETITKDIRNIVAEDLERVDAVVHLAELSNDPVGELAPKITYEINHAGSVRLARLAKAAGAQRFVYTSSCSVDGSRRGRRLMRRRPSTRRPRTRTARYASSATSRPSPTTPSSRRFCATPLHSARHRACGSTSS